MAEGMAEPAVRAGGRAPADVVLALERVSLHFGGLAVLDEVSLALRAGELLALIGPNGAGKTSVLNCICGIYRPQSGRIRFREHDLVGRRPHAVAGVGVARTFQHGELFPHLTVLQNLLVGRHSRIGTRPLFEALFTRSVREAEVVHRRRCEEVLDFVELSALRHRRVADLSFAQQKIVGFARALAMEPSVLLLDEPSAGLNRDAREDLARFILRIQHEARIPILWVEHDMQMVADLADRLYVLDHGRYLVDGTPHEVLSQAEVVRAYLGGAAPAGEPVGPRCAAAIDREPDRERSATPRRDEQQETR